MRQSSAKGVIKCSGGGNITIYGAAEEGELGDGNEICHGNGVNCAKYLNNLDS